MLSGRLKLALWGILLSHSPAFCFSANEIQLGLQLSKENTYRDTLNPSVDFHHSPLLWAKLKMGTTVFVSTQAIEGLIYRFEADAEPLAWIIFKMRGGQRTNFSDRFSHTSLMGIASLRFTPWEAFSFFISGGGYQRWVSINRSSFSTFDFATELGLKTILSKSITGLLKIATFDPWEVYNLNNPFIESSLELGTPESSEKWMATFRYQILLGFGRLDRLTFGLSYLTRW